MKKGLVLIDIQNDYFKGGRFELFHAEEAAKEAEKVLTFFRENKLPVFHVQHINLNEGATFFLPDTEGVNIYKGVLPKGNEQVVKKHTPNSFLNTDLKSLLDFMGIKDLVVCGMMTHMCVDTTVRAAKALGYNVTLIEDACATRNLVYKEEEIPASIVQKTFMASLNGMFADIVTATEWIKEYSN